MAAFDQVVAQDAVFRQFAVERLPEGVDVVDALADERPFAEQILVDIGHHARVRIDARLAAGEPGIERAPCAGERDADTRLKNSIAGDDAAELLIVKRPVERMRHRADQLSRRIARQLRIGVERDYVSDIGEHVDVAGDHREAILRFAAQQCVELLELAALSLPTHPQLLVRVPSARPVEQEEDVAFGVGIPWAILAVERIDSRARAPDQRGIIGHRFFRRVTQVSDQGEVQVAVLIGEKAYFERFEQRIDVGIADQHRRHHDDRPEFRWDVSGEIHLRQGFRIREQRCDPVDERDRQLATRHRDGDTQHHLPRRGDTARARQLQHERGEQRGEQQDRAEVKDERGAMSDPPQLLGDRQRNIHRRLELFDPVAIGEKESHMARSVVAIQRDVFVRELHGLSRHVGFAESRVLRDPFDLMAIVISGGKSHPAVNIGGVLTQLLFDDAHRLDEFAPVDRAQAAKTADAVADRHLVGGLLLRFRLDHLLDRTAAFGKPVLDPRQRERQHRDLSLQTPRELGHERADHPRIGAGHVGDDEDEVRRILLGDAHHLVCPLARLLDVERALRHARGDAAQIFDQRQPEHDRNAPQLAQLERRHRLIRGDEAAEAFGVDTSIGMRNGLERQVIHARQVRRRSLCESRKLTAIALRQVALRDADLLADQVEVVEQPLARGYDPAVVFHRPGQQIARRDQHGFVVFEPREQSVSGFGVRQPVECGKRLAVLFHLIGAEQLRAERNLFTGTRAAGGRTWRSAESHAHATKRCIERGGSRLENTGVADVRTHLNGSHAIEVRRT